MQRLAPQRLVLAAVTIVLACLAAGCGSAAKSVISSLPSRSASILPSRPPTSQPGPTATIAPSPTVTAAPAPQPTTQPAVTPAPTAQATGSPTPAGSGTNLLWLWIVLGVVVLIGVIVWIARSAGRRSAAAAGWRSRVIDGYAKGSALYDAMSVAEATGGPAAADAGARWSDIQRRADDLAQNLYALREAAPDEDARARVADAIASLQAVRSAMEAQHRPGGADAQHAEVVRARLSFFEASLRALRGAGERLA